MVGFIPYKDVIYIKKIITIIIIILTSILFRPIVKAEEKVKTLYFAIFSMDTTVEVTYDGLEANKEEIKEDITSLFEKYHLLSNNFETSESEMKDFSKYGIKESIYTINSQPEVVLEINKELYDILDLSYELYDLTDGYFDIGNGRVIDLWKEVIDSPENRQEGFVSSATWDKLMADLEEVEVYGKDAYVLTKDVENDQYFVKLKEGAKLDLGAISKGYVTELAASYLKDRGIENFNIISGKSSIKLNRDDSFDGQIKVSVSDPSNVSDYLGYLLVNPTSVTNSGVEHQYFLYDNIKYHHIISPKTKMAENFYYSVILVGGDLGVNDALSTAMFSMNDEEIKEFMEDNPELEVLLIKSDRSVETRLLNSTYTHEEIITNFEDENKTVKIVIVAILATVIVAGVSYLAVAAYKANKKED